MLQLISYFHLCIVCDHRGVRDRVLKICQTIARCWVLAKAQVWSHYLYPINASLSINNNWNLFDFKRELFLTNSNRTILLFNAQNIWIQINNSLILNLIPTKISNNILVRVKKSWTDSVLLQKTKTNKNGTT